jgi:hypothetical protein
MRTAQDKTAKAFTDAAEAIGTERVLSQFYISSTLGKRRPPHSVSKPWTTIDNRFHSFELSSVPRGIKVFPHKNEDLRATDELSLREISDAVIREDMVLVIHLPSHVIVGTESSPQLCDGFIPNTPKGRSKNGLSRDRSF